MADAIPTPASAEPQPPSASLPQPPSASFDLPQPPGAAEALAAAEQAARTELVTSYFSPEPPKHLGHLVPYRNALAPMRADVLKHGWSDEDNFEFQQAAHALGVTQGQLAGLAQVLVKRGRAGLQRQTAQLAAAAAREPERIEQARRQTRQALESEWGERTVERLQGAESLGRRILGDQFDSIVTLELRDGSTLGDHRAFVRALAASADRLASLEASNMASGRDPLTVSPLTAWKLAKKLVGSEAAQDRGHPDHDEVVAQSMAWFTIANAPPLDLRPAPPTSRAAPAPAAPRAREPGTISTSRLLEEPVTPTRAAAEEELQAALAKYGKAWTNKADPDHSFAQREIERRIHARNAAA